MGPPFGELGNSVISITSTGLGSWAIDGDGWEYSLVPQDGRESIAAVHCALDLGTNWIATSALYGLGYSEEAAHGWWTRSSPASTARTK